eukprot:TRINITY_DN30956_c0_g1_i4.p1 TRINITY_DN30956_c0_g1~~TRINITY_DN30956_c0_g1_i4.p1  ORF type:complete len:653 (-),score=80.61 TRINITY_DN30956_c0_g1_i4:49-2007(-)
MHQAAQAWRRSRSAAGPKSSPARPPSGSAAELADWIARLGQISGDARKELSKAAVKNGWDVDAFGHVVSRPSQQRSAVHDILSPTEAAAVLRAWKMDFGRPQSSSGAGYPMQRPRSSSQGGLRGAAGQRAGAAAPSWEQARLSTPVKQLPGASHDFMDPQPLGPHGHPASDLPAWAPEAPAAGQGLSRVVFPPSAGTYMHGFGGRPQARAWMSEGPDAGPDGQSRRVRGNEHRPPHVWDAPWAEDRDLPASERGDLAVGGVAGIGDRGGYGRNAAHRKPEEGWSPRQVKRPTFAAEDHRPELLTPPQRPMAERGMWSPSVDASGSDVEDRLRDAHSLAASPDSDSVYVISPRGLMRFDAKTLALLAAVQYRGSALSPGYADVAVGENSVVCVDLEGTLFEHDPETLELRGERAYQPSVVDSTQRIVGGKLKKCSAPIAGLEGGFGGVARVAVGADAVYIGGRDGVVTAYAAGSLNVIARCKLIESAQPLGVQMVYLAGSGRLYCGALSTLCVLTKGLHMTAKLCGGPRVPVFGSFSCVVESNDGSKAIAADVGGPAIHIWATDTWRWLSRVELAAAGGHCCHLAVSPDDVLIYASTEHGRFLAYSLQGSQPRCVEEGSGGGPLAVLRACTRYVVVLLPGRLMLRHCTRWNLR